MGSTSRVYRSRYITQSRAFGSKSGRARAVRSSISDLRSVAPSILLAAAGLVSACLVFQYSSDEPKLFRNAYAESLNEDYRQRYSRTKDAFKTMAVLQEVQDAFERPREGTPLSHANSMLKKLEMSSIYGNVRVDACGLPSNSILGEDRSSAGEATYVLPDGTREPLYCWGIYDGHAGHATADVLQSTLQHIVCDRVIGLHEEAKMDEVGAGHPSSHEIEEAIKSGFLITDAMIMGSAEAFLEDPNIPPASLKAIGRLAPALSGSCALLCLFEPATSMLRVACVGDSRAVLGRVSGSGDYSAIPMSIDQTGFNASEVARLATEHPADEKIIDEKTGRLHGLAVTRAFGDARWKWTGRLAQAQRFDRQGC